MNCHMTKRKLRGQSLVEFALVLPILLLTVMGVVEFGRIFMTQQVITNASREGARAAILPGNTEAEVYETVSTYMSSAGLVSGLSLETSNVGENVQPGVQTSVTVRYDLPILSGSIIPGLGETILLENTTVMRDK